MNIKVLEKILEQNKLNMDNNIIIEISNNSNNSSSNNNSNINNV